MFGFLAIFVLSGAIAVASRPEHLAVLIFPIFMGVFFYFILKATVFDLVDEVWDAGDYLVVKNRGEEATVRLEDIINVNSSRISNTKRVELRLRKGCRFGNEIAFIPVAKPSFWPPFAKNPMVEKLIDRIDAARRKHGG